MVINDEYRRLSVRRVAWCVLALVGGGRRLRCVVVGAEIGFVGRKPHLPAVVGFSQRAAACRQMSAREGETGGTAAGNKVPGALDDENDPPRVLPTLGREPHIHRTAKGGRSNRSLDDRLEQMLDLRKMHVHDHTRDLRSIFHGHTASIRQGTERRNVPVYNTCEVARYVLVVGLQKIHFEDFECFLDPFLDTLGLIEKLSRHALVADPLRLKRRLDHHERRSQIIEQIDQGSALRAM